MPRDPDRGVLGARDAIPVTWKLAFGGTGAGGAERDVPRNGTAPFDPPLSHYRAMARATRARRDLLLPAGTCFCEGRDRGDQHAEVP